MPKTQHFFKLQKFEKNMYGIPSIVPYKQLLLQKISHKVPFLACFRE